VTSATDFAIDFGGGVQFDVAPNMGLTFDARYSLGLSDLDKSAVPPGEVDGTIKSRGFQIMLGVLFRVGK
jgi:opacity protein-like surface antigen